MALSWIFGGKKKEEKPVTVEPIILGSEEGFTLVHNNAGFYPPPLYPPLPYIPLPQQHQSTSSSNTNVQSQLDGVSFILSPKLETSSQHKLQQTALERIRSAVIRITADVNDTNYDYDFKLEHSVMEETSGIFNTDS